MNATSPSFRVPGTPGEPYETYHRLRAEQPVCWDPKGTGAWKLLRYHDICDAMQDPRLGAVPAARVLVEGLTRSGHGPLTRMAQDGSGVLLFLDPPAHSRLRSLSSKAFTARAVDSLRGRIEALVLELLDGLGAARRFDLIQSLAVPLPMTVICELLGAPTGDLPRLTSWSRHMASLLDVADLDSRVAESARQTAEGFKYFLGLIGERRRKPAQDLLSTLVQVHEGKDTLTDAEVATFSLFILAAGNITTTNLIGNGVLGLLRHRGELEKLRQDPALMGSAVEEFLRYDSPIQRSSRVALDDLEIGGTTVRKGAIVTLMLGAGNRDPARFAEPDRLDITRPDNRHLAFGGGIHVCLGASLARLEGQIAIAALLERFPSMRLASDSPDWLPGRLQRGLRSLPLAV